MLNPLSAGTPLNRLPLCFWDASDCLLWCRFWMQGQTRSLPLGSETYRSSYRTRRAVRPCRRQRRRETYAAFHYGMCGL